MNSPTHRRVFQVNAFTRDKNGGNPAGVVLDADGLSDEEMRGIANTLKAPDTAFVFSPPSADHDARLRFLTPRHETTFVGHATIAAQYIRAKIDGKAAPRQRLLTGMGLVEIDVLQVDGDYRIGITQRAPILGPIFPEQHRPDVFRALGLSPGDIHPDLPLQLVAQKAPRLLIGVRSPEVLSSLKPDFAGLKRLSPQVGAEGYFVFGLGPRTGSASTQSRLFCPVMGIPEDPVSGNTHAMLGVYLVQHGVLVPENGIARFQGHQGAFVGRAGIVEVEVLCEGLTPRAVRILGDAVIAVSSGTP